MHEYLFNRTTCPPADAPPSLLADQVFFNLWTTRQSPFNEFESGDRLWWVDKATREIRWELRAVEVLKHQYHSPSEALRLLRRGYGLLPDDLDDYFTTTPASGWLLAFAVEVMQSTPDVRLPDGERLGRNGLRRISAELRDSLQAVGLPQPANAAMTRPQSTVGITAVSAVFAPSPSRHIPAAVKAAVWEASGGFCQDDGCGKPLDRDEVHFDHHIPFSRGGPSTVENLRVLCAPCNLAKGAKMPPRADIRTFDEPVADLAAVVGRHQPQKVGDLVALLHEAVQMDEIAAARAAVLTLHRDLEFADADVDLCIDAVRGAPGLDDFVALLQVHRSPDPNVGLRELLASDDEDVRLEAGVDLCFAGEMELDLARQILLEAVEGRDRYLSDLAVLTAAGIPELASDASLPPLESLLGSPVLVWRCVAALALAEELFEHAGDGEELDVDRFVNLCHTALASPDTGAAHGAALLLAEFWAEGADDEKARRWAEQYLDFAEQSDNPVIRTDVGAVRDQLAEASVQPG